MNGWKPWQSAEPGDFCVVGDPISHSLSPAIHGAAYAELGMSLSYRAFQVPVGELEEAFQRLAKVGYIGANVTLPHKEAAFQWCTGVSPLAADCGAVNTVQLGDREGTNTDGPAIVSVLVSAGIAPGSRVLILGAGGTAKTAVFALAQNGFLVSAYNRTPGRLQGLPPECEILAEPDPSGAQAILNCTSAGHSGACPEIMWDRAEACTVFDANYGPAHRPLRAASISRGLTVHDGSKLLLEQAALAFEWWTHKEAPRTAMMKALHERLEPYS